MMNDIDRIYSAVIADDEALEDAQMTLHAIKKADPGTYDEIIDDSLALIRKALSCSILSAVDRLADPDQDPVAWMHTSAVGNIYFRKKPQDKVFNPQPLYLAPQKRKWEGLTDEEIKKLSDDCAGVRDETEFIRAIEAKLKEKNT